MHFLKPKCIWATNIWSIRAVRIRETPRRKKLRTASMAVDAQSLTQLGEVRTEVLSNARLACYKARDAFYDCLEKESSKKPTEIAAVGLLYPAECKKTRVAYEKQCRSSWVKHFDRDYCAKKKVKRFLDDPNAKRGPLSLPQP